MRDKVLFSSKSNWARAPRASVVRRSIERSLRKTGLDYFDLYQIWGLRTADALRQALSKGGTIEGVRQAQREGLIKFGLGFTFHGDAPLFQAAIDTGEFLCATVSYNLLKRVHEELLDYAASHGVGTIIMNPLAGGLLADERDKSLDFLRQHDRGPWYGALRFLLANESISTCIVGYTSADQVDLNVQALEGADALGDEYRQELALRMAAAKLVEGDFCTGCGYCQECPNGFDPTRFMQAVRDYAVYGAGETLTGWLQAKYVGQSLAEELQKCVECGWCKEQCPQGLDIVQEIRRAKELFT
jgi:predicted aldo/keto reductase-like oxidoreductase